MYIHALAQEVGIAAPTIRYYEETGILPTPRRDSNGYRLYDEADVDRLRFVARARALELSLETIGEILRFREQGMTPCTYVSQQIDHKIEEIDQRIALLSQLKAELQMLQTISHLPTEEVSTKNCICHIIDQTNNVVPS
jgi:DNA-binding transcriptional MerR regulator